MELIKLTTMFDELKDKAADLMNNENVQNVVNKAKDLLNSEQAQQIIENVKDKASELFNGKSGK